MGRADSDNAGGSGRGGGGVGGGSSGGGRGGGFDGRDTPGSPNAADGKRGSTMGRDGGRATGGGGGNSGGAPPAAQNRGRDTPGAPTNVGRRGDHAAGSTASSRARDAMSRHQNERDRTSISRGGIAVGDLDASAGLGAEHAMDSQQTENSLNRAGVTDSLGMTNTQRLGAAERAGAALSSTERQQKAGIVAGHDNQFAANRVNDVLGAVPGVGMLTEAVVERTRPSEVMAVDYNEGRALANSVELGTLGETAVGLGMNKLGISAPMGPVNFAQAVVRDKIQNADVHTLRDKGMGAGTPSAPAGSGNGAQRAVAAMQPQAPAAPATQGFEWNPVDIDEYSKGLLMQAQG